MTTNKLTTQTHLFLKSKTGQMFLGLILGDGSLTYRFEHSQQKLYWEYSRYICQQFKTEYPKLLTKKISQDDFYIKQRNNPKSPTDYFSQTFYTRSHPIFKELRQIFYPNGKKIIPMEVIETYFTEVSLLFLYLDDGIVGRKKHHGIGFALGGFTEQQLTQFQCFLDKKFKLKVTIQSRGKYQVLYVKMASSNKILFRWNQLTEIVNSIGVIRETKLQQKKLLPTHPAIKVEEMVFSKNVKYQFPEKEFHQNNPEISGLERDLNQAQLELKGVIQAFIIGGSYFLWNKGYSSGYLRLRLKKNSQFTTYVIEVFKSSLTDPVKITETKTHFDVGVKITTDLIPHVNEVMTRDFQIKKVSKIVCKNPWFLKALFCYKGRDLKVQRGGLTIGLNHLPIDTVDAFSKVLNDIYSFKTKLRFRNNKTKASIYIPVGDSKRFY